MKKSTKISITTESRELFILHVAGRSRLRVHCAACGGEREMLTLDQAVSLSGLAAREVVRRMQAAEIFCWETDSGHWFFCGSCLKQGHEALESGAGKSAGGSL